MDLGCGDGNQLSLANYPRYVGLDISPTAVATCEQRFRDDSTKRFQVYDPRDFDPTSAQADMSMSIEVISSLIEDELFDLHMTHLFALATRNVVIMSSDVERPAKGAHVRRRAFTPWIAENARDWELVECIENPRKSGSDAGARSDIYSYRRRGGTEPSATWLLSGRRTGTIPGMH